MLALAAEPAIERLMLLQIAFSDMVVLNKVTMAGPGEVAAVRGWIDAHFDNIRVFATDFAEVPDEVLLSVGRYAAAALGRAGSTPDETPDPGGDHPRFDTWTYATEAPMSPPLLRRAMDRLPGSVFRCKGHRPHVRGTRAGERFAGRVPPRRNHPWGALERTCWHQVGGDRRTGQPAVG